MKKKGYKRKVLHKAGEFKNLFPTGIRQLVKYGLVGLLNVAIYWSFFEILTRVYHWHYFNANLAASLISFSNSLYFNRKWTFKSEGSWKKDFLYFAVIFLICTTIQSGVLVVLVEKYQQDPQLAKYAGIVAFAAFNFTLNKFVTFRNKPESL